jgi:DNA-binding protein HU-beta
MTKKDLVLELAQTRGMPPKEARLFVEAFLRTIERALSEGDSVTLRSFGRFDVQPRAGRRIRTPRGTTDLRIPARLAPVFHYAPALGRRVGQGAKRKP